MRRLRPNSVSRGTTDMQLDFALQSPQPSQTRSLTNRRRSGSGILPPLSPPALLGCAGLVVDEHAHPWTLAQLPLHPVERAAGLDAGTGGKAILRARVLLRLLAHHDDSLHALRAHLPRDPHGVERPVDGLTPGHRHRVVVEDLVGDIDAGRDAGADREQPAVVVGAVAEILEHVGRVHEGSLSDPGRALPAHLGMGQVVALHVGRHVVAADPAVGAAALRAPAWSGCGDTPSRSTAAG